jgi:hypothetical protein
LLHFKSDSCSCMECVKATAVQADEASEREKKLRFSIDLSVHPFNPLLPAGFN